MLRLLPLLMLLLLTAIFFQVDFFFNVLYLMMGAWLLGQAWVHYNVRHLHIHRHFATRAFHGDDIPVQVTLTNTGRLPLTWLTAQDSLPVDLITPALQRGVFSLNPGETHTLAYTLHARHRGVYRIGPLRATTGDLLGLLDPMTLENTADTLLVYPRLVPLPALNLPVRSPLAEIPALTPLFEDPARVVGVRTYQPGDSFRRIHWKATAQSGALLVKRYQPAIARDLLMVLDVHPDHYPWKHRHDSLELAFTVAASVAQHSLTHHRQPVGLLCSGYDGLEQTRRVWHVPPHAERAFLMPLLEALARAQPAPTDVLAELRTVRPRLAWGTTLLFITGHDSPDLLAALAEFHRAGFPLALVLVGDAAPSPAARRQALTWHMPLYHARRASDLATWS